MGLVIVVPVLIIAPLTIIKPINALSLHLNEISKGHGDSSIRLPVESSDEIGDTAKAFNAFLDELQDLVRSIAEVTKTVDSINDLISVVQNAAAVVQDLEKESANVAAVLEVIKSVADQTKLVVLNATIEAARAGEQGRDFAVVADEVRTLASRTQGSAQEIQSMINALQSQANRAVRVMNEGYQKAQTSQHRADTTGGALDKITAMNSQIAAAGPNNKVRSATKSIIKR